MARPDRCEYPGCSGGPCDHGELWRAGACQWCETGSGEIPGITWQSPELLKEYPGLIKAKPRKRKESRGRPRRLLPNRKPRLRADQKHDLRIFPRYEHLDPAEAELLQPDSGFRIIETGATGAPAHRPKKGVQDSDLITREEWASLMRVRERIAKNPWIVRAVRWRELTPKKQERLCQALYLAEMQNVNIDAFVRDSAWKKRTVYDLRKYGQEVRKKLMLQAETLERIKRLEHKLDQLLATCDDTAQRVREQFPNDAEVSQAVDRFLSDISAQPRRKAA